jgi:hypothetical protein
MRLPSRTHDAAQVRRFSSFTGELRAVTLGRRPLIAEDVGRWWLTIGSEEIDKSQSEKSALPQANVRGGRWLIRHALQEDRMG